jgi:hypothetical protein
MVWDLVSDGETPGVAKRSLHGHNHFVSDVTLSQDGQYCLSASWDATLRLWDITTGETTKQFVGHKKDCLSVAFSPDNRQIVSGSRDHTIKLWNTIGECKLTIDEAHGDWVSCVRYSPNTDNPVIVSAGWDKAVRVTQMNNFRDRRQLTGHSGYLNTVTVSPDGSLCASGGKDGIAMLWDLNEARVRGGGGARARARGRRAESGGGVKVQRSSRLTPHPPSAPRCPAPDALRAALRLHHQLAHFLAEPLLAVRGDEQGNHDLGPRVQEHGRRAALPQGGRDRPQGAHALLHVARVVRRRPHALLGLDGPRHPRLWRELKARAARGGVLSIF